ncbi:hypothetical protein EMIHUDRAFT_241767, partial [Emiliania huxleyi CCMP1516]|uniref:SEC7 domain-containing protein n=2 Tax=Emiliania huxleyi TaxID=2903 RepID=A0A0D3JBE1_EMIH1
MASTGAAAREHGHLSPPVPEDDGEALLPSSCSARKAGGRHRRNPSGGAEVAHSLAASLAAVSERSAPPRLEAEESAGLLSSTGLELAGLAAAPYGGEHGLRSGGEEATSLAAAGGQGDDEDEDDRGSSFFFAAPLGDIAAFLHETKGLSKRKLGDYLGERGERHAELLSAYVRRFDFAGLSFVGAIRAFLSPFRLPGEAQR